MLDLAFVRTNLDLVKEKLRSRGGDPDALLADFDAIDRERRAAISQLEILNANRNRLTGEIQAARKSGDDASALTEQVRALKSEAEGLEKSAAQADERLRDVMQTLPNLPQDSVPKGTSEHDNVVVKTWGEPVIPANAKPHWEIGENARRPRLRTRRQDLRRTLRHTVRPGRTAGARTRQLHAGPAHHSSTATPKFSRPQMVNSKLALRHRKPPQVR